MKRKPNIILINCDDLGYGDLGCYGSTLNDTPALDRMAAEGMRLSDFYMMSPVCSPSRGGMLTGCYPPRVGFAEFEGRAVLFPGQGVGLNPKERTLGSILKEAGYATACVGKWHCGDQPEFLPTQHGFDRYFGLPYSNDMGRQTPDDPNPPLPLLENESTLQEQPDQTALTERYVAESVRFIREKKDGPFFLYFAHMHVHLPHYPPPRFAKQSRNGPYGGAVACIDWATEVLLHELKTQGIDEETLVIFTSDNGSRAAGEGGSNAPLRGTKGTVWEGGMRVPCIARWPGKIPAGSTSSQLAAAMDFLPTFAELAGVDLNDGVDRDGRSILPILRREPNATSPHEAFFYYRGERLEAVREGPWKLICASRETETALFNLEEDIGETRNRIREFPEVAKQLQERADEMAHRLGDTSRALPNVEMRPKGRVEHPQPLTEYRKDHPYIEAYYDLPNRG